MYNPSDWYWLIGGKKDEVWSSSVAKFVKCSDDSYVLWLSVNGAPSQLATLEELGDVLLSQYSKGAPITPNVIREKRRVLLLMANDAINTLEDNGLSTDSFRAWRIALREIPEQKGFPNSVEWPAVPMDVELPPAQMSAIAQALESK